MFTPTATAAVLATAAAGPAAPHPPGPEAVGRAADSTIQIYGGMGLMEELPIERLWRDARLDRIWDGTSEIQRHIISRSLLRQHGA